MTEVVKFNISGQRYEVSRSLLQIHPNSMLAKSASDQWQEDPEAEIFMEGDGTRFRYVMDYLRHRSVSLPPNETKEALVKEMEYYGIDVDEDAIDDTAMHKAKSVDSMGIAMMDLSKNIVNLKSKFVAEKDDSDKAEVKYRCGVLARDYIKVYLLKLALPDYRKGQSYDVVFELNRDDEARKNIEALNLLVNCNHEKVRKEVNVHLRSVGLHMKMKKFSSLFTATLEEIAVSR